MDLNTEELCRQAIMQKESARRELLNIEPGNFCQALITSRQIAVLEREIRCLKFALAKFGG